MNVTFYTGSYSGPRQLGICRCTADFEARKWTMEPVNNGIENPSFVLLHPEKKMLYSVSEQTPEGALWAFPIDTPGLGEHCTLPSGGADPCHLALHSSGKWLAVSNYTSGSLAIFRLDNGGVPVQRTSLIHYSGIGFRPDRQQGPHIHFAKFRQDSLFVTDLGLDRVYHYTLDCASGNLELLQTVTLAKGSGPRHLVFHPDNGDWMYVVCELASAVTVIQKAEQGWQVVQMCSTLPDDYTGESIAAAIRISPDGKTLFASNRGHDSIAAFSVDENGCLQKIQVCKTGGKVPRDFEIFDPYLVCANQGSDNLTVLSFDENKQILSPYPMELALYQPACICPETSGAESQACLPGTGRKEE